MAAANEAGKFAYNKFFAVGLFRYVQIGCWWGMWGQRGQALKCMDTSARARTVSGCMGGLGEGCILTNQVLCDCGGGVRFAVMCYWNVGSDCCHSL